MRAAAAAAPACSGRTPRRGLSGASHLRAAASLGSRALTRGRTLSLPEQAPGGRRRTVPVHSAAGLRIASGLVVVGSEHIKQLLVVLRQVHAVGLGVIAHCHAVILSALLLCRQHHATQHTAGD